MSHESSAMLTRPEMAKSPAAYLATHTPDRPIHFFARAALAERLRQFKEGFPGLVTYAVKANPAEHVLEQLWAGGINGFDVASPDEIALVSRLCPGAAMHYNNPVRTPAEIRFAQAVGMQSWSVDDERELDKLLAADHPQGTEIAVRFRLAVGGAVYNFGSKFGADEAGAARLLQRVKAAGMTPALTFHVGTQCADPGAYGSYVRAAATIARAAGVAVARLNVGGGFPSGRDGNPVDLKPFFDAIRDALGGFDTAPVLVCEPGRGMVADTFAFAVQVKSLRDTRVYLTDGIYGGLAEFTSMTLPRYDVFSAGGSPRIGTPRQVSVFGPTCDSIDRLPGTPPMPDDLAEGDWIVFGSMGAYLTGMTTRFNGYGQWDCVEVASV